MLHHLGDIIIERWVPYGAAAKRKTIVQRADAAKEYEKPRNIIIQYEAVQVRIVRQFQRLGVTQENPQAYVQRYGAQLLDVQALLSQARSAGVVEDIVRIGIHRCLLATLCSSLLSRHQRVPSEWPRALLHSVKTVRTPPEPLKEPNSPVVQVENTVVLRHRSPQAASRARKLEAPQVCFSMSLCRFLYPRTNVLRWSGGWQLRKWSS